MWQCRSPRMSSSVTSSRQRRRRRRLELAAALAQLGRDPRQAEPRVDLLLGRAAHRLARLVVEDPVLGDVQPAADRRLAQLHVVRLGAGEVLQHVAELVGLDDLEVDLHPRVGRTRAPFSPDDSTDSTSGSSASAAASAAGSSRGGDDVEVLDRVGAAAQRAGELDAVGGRVRAQRADDLLGDAGARESSRRAAAACRRAPAASTSSSCLLDLRRRSRAARGSAGSRHAARSASSESIAELVVEPARALGPEARQVRDRDQPGRVLARAASRRPGCRRSRSSAWSFSSSVLPIPAQLGRAALAGQRGHGHRRVAHRLGRVAVGDHAVLDGAVELVEVAELVEGGGDLGVREVGHGRLRYGARDRPRLGHPPHLRRGREHRGRSSPRCRARPRPTGHRILVVDDASPDGTGASPTASRPQLERRGAAPAAQARASAAPTSPASRTRSAGGAGHVFRDGRRLLPRPRRPAAAAGRVRATAPTSCSARATCRAAASRTGGRRAARSSRARAASTRARAAASPVRDLTGGFKCFRAEALEAIDYRACARRATPSRSS